MTICDCERSHNGCGMAGRECDCGPPTPESVEAALRAVLAERDALQGQLNDLRNGWANSVKAHAALLAERDAAFAAGQEEMLKRVFDLLSEVKGIE